MTTILCPECGGVYTSEDSPSCPHDEPGSVVTIRLQERDRNGHGKRRRKRRPSAECCEIRLPNGSIRGTSTCDGNTRHVSARNMGRKPKGKR